MHFADRQNDGVFDDSNEATEAEEVGIYDNTAYDSYEPITKERPVIGAYEPLTKEKPVSGYHVNSICGNIVYDTMDIFVACVNCHFIQTSYMLLIEKTRPNTSYAFICFTGRVFD